MAGFKKREDLPTFHMLIFFQHHILYRKNTNCFSYTFIYGFFQLPLLHFNFLCKFFRRGFMIISGWLAKDAGVKRNRRWIEASTTKINILQGLNPKSYKSNSWIQTAHLIRCVPEDENGWLCCYLIFYPWRLRDEQRMKCDMLLEMIGSLLLNIEIIVFINKLVCNAAQATNDWAGGVFHVINSIFGVKNYYRRPNCYQSDSLLFKN